MNRIILVFFCLLLIGKATYAQENQDSIKVNLHSDTIKIVFPSLQLEYDRLAIFRPEKELYNPQYNEAGFLWFRSLPNNYVCFVNERLSMSNSFLVPTFTNYRESQRNSAFTYVLGVVEGAAAGYLAYEHIRKYGFWERKKK